MGLLVLGSASCSSGALDEGPVGEGSLDSVEVHEQKWAESAPNEYVVRVCTQGFAQYECTQDAVAGGRVIASKRWTWTETSVGWVSLDAALQAEPIARLFDAARSVPDAADCRLNVTFDEQYGYVSSYVYLCFEASGEQVECFAPGVTNLEACGDPNLPPPSR